MFETFLGKLIIFIEKLFKFNASSFPGEFILKISPNYLKKLKYPNLIIMVTGSSGKGSTVKLIDEILKENNMKVCSNTEGSNLIYGITTSIIKYTRFNKLRCDALVLECDERYLKLVTKYIKPNYLLINNITRDQPPRQGSFDIVFNEILKGINKDTHLILNGDDPILRKFSLVHKGKITYYGINKTKYSYKERDDIKDYIYCPKCHHKLIFSYYHYGSVGDYKCPNCDFKRDNITYEITKVDYKNNQIVINNKDIINVNNFILSNLYNIISSYSLSSLININKDIIINAINKSSINKKLFNEFTIDNKKYTILNCKAENNATFNLSLIYTSMDKKKKNIVLGFGQISRRYKHYDLSWLYDIYFELLNTCNINKIICVGPYKYDIALRLKYSNIDEDKLILLDNFDNMKDKINKLDGEVYAILNFDYVDPFIKSIKEENK